MNSLTTSHVLAAEFDFVLKITRTKKYQRTSLLGEKSMAREEKNDFLKRLFCNFCLHLFKNSSFSEIN